MGTPHSYRRGGPAFFAVYLMVFFAAFLAGVLLAASFLATAFAGAFFTAFFVMTFFAAFFGDTVWAAFFVTVFFAACLAGALLQNLWNRGHSRANAVLMAPATSDAIAIPTPNRFPRLLHYLSLSHSGPSIFMFLCSYGL
jgi:hypothetical protein